MTRTKTKLAKEKLETEIKSHSVFVEKNQCARLFGTTSRMTRNGFLNMCIAHYPAQDTTKKLSSSTKDCATCSIGYLNSINKHTYPEGIDWIEVGEFTELTSKIIPPHKISDKRHFDKLGEALSTESKFSRKAISIETDTDSDSISKLEDLDKVEDMPLIPDDIDSDFGSESII